VQTIFVALHADRRRHEDRLRVETVGDRFDGVADVVRRDAEDDDVGSIGRHLVAEALDIGVGTARLEFVLRIPRPRREPSRDPSSQ